MPDRKRPLQRHASGVAHPRRSMDAPAPIVIQPDLLDTEDVVGPFFHRAPRTMERWRRAEYGPRFRYYGKRPLYLGRDVIAFRDNPDATPKPAPVDKQVKEIGDPRPRPRPPTQHKGRR